MVNNNMWKEELKLNERDVIDAIEYVRKYNTETNKIEIKSAKCGFPKKCYDTFSSFSNKNGGIIIFGLSEEKGFVTEGVYDLNDLQRQISSLCSDSMYPVLRVDILPMEFEEKNILAVKVDELNQNKKPCYYKPRGLMNGAYIRIGESDELMTNYEIYAIESYNDHIVEDIRPNKKGTIDDLNKENIEKYISKIKRDKPHFAKIDFEKCLKICGIMDTNNTDVYPTLAGTIIFSDYPQAFYPQLFVACAVIPGTELGDVGSLGERFIDNKKVDGNIEEMLDGTMQFLRRNMKTRVIINEDGKRIDRTEYPLEALREAVANALTHRDYSVQTENAYISVYMYSDRIEIINPGALYGSNKLEKLGTYKSMEVRNPHIVSILEEKDSVIENRHTGIPTMIREMKKYGLSAPEFYNERDSFKVIFRNSIKNLVGGQEEWTRKVDKKSGQESKTIKHYKELVIKFCNKPRTSKEIREYLNIKSRQYVSSKILKPLIDEGKIEYTNKNGPRVKNQQYVTKN